MQFLRTPKPEPPSPAAGLAFSGGFYELSMYKEAPAGEVALEDFEKIALDRLRGEGGGRRAGPLLAPHALATCFALQDMIQKLLFALQMAARRCAAAG